MNDQDFGINDLDTSELFAALDAYRVSDAPESGPFSEPAPGQFHSLAVDSDMWEAFVLVLETSGSSCRVISGSMDACKGGPDDILIPAPAPGDVPFWTLNLDSEQDLMRDALLAGFARLAPGMLDYVKDGLRKFRNGEPLGNRYRFCLPYIGEDDSRIAYRDELASLVKTAQDSARRAFFDRVAASLTWSGGASDGDGAPDETIPRRERNHPYAASGMMKFASFGESFARKGKFDILSMVGKFMTPPVAASRIESFDRIKSRMREDAAEEKKEMSDAGLEPAAGEKDLRMVDLSAVGRRETISLIFRPDDIPCLLEVSWSRAEGRMDVRALRRGDGPADPGAFDGIQLRRTSDGDLVGEIRGGVLSAEFRETSVDGIYFSRAGNIPIRGTWEKRK